MHVPGQRRDDIQRTELRVKDDHGRDGGSRSRHRPLDGNREETPAPERSETTGRASCTWPTPRRIADRRAGTPRAKAPPRRRSRRAGERVARKRRGQRQGQVEARRTEVCRTWPTRAPPEHRRWAVADVKGGTRSLGAQRRPQSSARSPVVVEREFPRGRRPYTPAEATRTSSRHRPTRMIPFRHGREWPLSAFPLSIVIRSRPDSDAVPGRRGEAVVDGPLVERLAHSFGHPAPVAATGARPGSAHGSMSPDLFLRQRHDVDAARSPQHEALSALDRAREA